jgi:3-oxoacyl-[acyl-carrier protein] reductase
MAGVTGRVALITGASQGIGRACALALAEAGANVALAARNEEKLAAVVKEAEAKGVKSAAFRMDVADEDSVKGAVKAAIAQFGRVDILINNVFGQMGQAGQANYAASKAGLIGFTMAMAREVASRNITVNAVAPGYIETAMTEDLAEELKSKVNEMIPLGRAGTDMEVAHAVRFLASEEASYITGHVLMVNGGMLMG